LVVWQKAMDLATSVYLNTENLPVTEKFGLLIQIRRCAVSICSTIAEDAGRNTKGEFVQFLGIANGSAYELEAQLELLNRLKYIDESIKNKLCDEVEVVQKMLYNLMKSMR
jgi:four helix bundle protein